MVIKAPAALSSAPMVDCFQWSARMVVQTARARQRLREIEADIGRMIDFRAPFGEDLLICDLLEGQSAGFFVEIGAGDGYTSSATYALETMGWHGLLIEADEFTAGVCRERRTASRVVHADVTGNEPVDVPSCLVFKAAARTTIEALLEDHEGAIDVAVVHAACVAGGVLDRVGSGRWSPRILIVTDCAGSRDLEAARVMAGAPYVEAGVLETSRVYVRRDCAAIIERMHSMGQRF